MTTTSETHAKKQKMKIYTPDDARNLAANLLEPFSGMASCVITGASLDEFLEASNIAQELCKQPATAATCRQIETCLGTMVSLFLDAPLLDTKPREQVQVVLDIVEMVGSACHAAGRSNLH